MNVLGLCLSLFLCETCTEYVASHISYHWTTIPRPRVFVHCKSYRKDDSTQRGFSNYIFSVAVSLFSLCVRVHGSGIKSKFYLLPVDFNAESVDIALPSHSSAVGSL